MLKIADFYELNLAVTWKVLYLGFCANADFSRQFLEKDIIEYAVSQLENGNDNADICELAGTYENQTDEICKILRKLSNNENSDMAARKIRAVIVAKALKTKADNFVTGLTELASLWAELGYPDDSPHIIQGRQNDIEPKEYYTKSNYDALYQKNMDWLENELTQLGK